MHTIVDKLTINIINHVVTAKLSYKSKMSSKERCIIEKSSCIGNVGHNHKTLNETSTYYQKLKEFREAFLSGRSRGDLRKV